jgi:hypothetical protein
MEKASRILFWKSLGQTVRLEINWKVNRNKLLIQFLLLFKHIMDYLLEIGLCRIYNDQYSKQIMGLSICSIVVS